VCAAPPQGVGGAASVLSSLASAAAAVPAQSWEQRALVTARDADPFWVPVRPARRGAARGAADPRAPACAPDAAPDARVWPRGAPQARGPAAYALPPTLLQVVSGVRPPNWVGPPPTLTQARARARCVALRSARRP
jgi:hypothetical protein